MSGVSRHWKGEERDIPGRRNLMKKGFLGTQKACSGRSEVRQPIWRKHGVQWVSRCELIPAKEVRYRL